MRPVRRTAALAVLLAAGCLAAGGDQAAVPTTGVVARLGPVTGAGVAGAPEGVGPAAVAASTGPVWAALPGASAPGTIPPVVNHGPRSGNQVALTFDADMTDAMLAMLAADPRLSYANVAVVDILENAGTPATFFLTGMWVRRYPDLTRRLAADPSFELANHTWRHSAFRAGCYDLPVLAPGARAADVARTFEVIGDYGGRQTRYFRFPGGCYDAAALRSLAGLGLTVVGWDVVSGDAFAAAARPIVDQVLSQVRPGSIVVLHLTEANARYTAQALPAILAGLRARGLVPVTVSELLRGSGRTGGHTRAGSRSRLE